AACHRRPGARRSAGRASPIPAPGHRFSAVYSTMWAPPPLLGFLGGALNALGALRIATEIYPAGSRARLAALAVAGADLYGGLRFTPPPAKLLAHPPGGLRFPTHPVLPPPILPPRPSAPARPPRDRPAAGPLLPAAPPV